MKKIWLLFLLVAMAFGQDVSPKQVKPGTFQNGTYTFPGNVAGGATVLDATGVTTTVGNDYAARFTTNVTTAGGNRYNVAKFLCNVNVPGGKCYASLFQTKDNTNGSAYSHIVGPQVNVTELNTYPANYTDVYGLPIGLTLAAGVWKGAGVRIEPQPDGNNVMYPGQIATGYDMVAGITPTVLYARPQCTTGYCVSAVIDLAGMSAGTATEPVQLYADSSGNFHVNPLTTGLTRSFYLDRPGYLPATSSVNIPGTLMQLGATAWDGAQTQNYYWTFQHNINLSGSISLSQLEIMPPTLPGGAYAQILLPANLVSGTTSGPATASNNYPSPKNCFLGSVWNGSAGIKDSWCQQVTYTSGANPHTQLSFTHPEGSAGLAIINFPASTYLQFGTATVVDNAANVQAGGGATIVYRCSVAGAARAGALTTVSADCGTAVDTGLRVK